MIVVAQHAQRVELAHAVDGFVRLAVVAGHVAEAHDTVSAGDIRHQCIERGQVAVDVAEDRKAHGLAVVLGGLCVVCLLKAKDSLLDLRDFTRIEVENRIAQVKHPRSTRLRGINDDPIGICDLDLSPTELATVERFLHVVWRVEKQQIDKRLVRKESRRLVDVLTHHSVQHIADTLTR